MAWSAVGSAISLKTDWQYTEPIIGSYFKLKHSSFPANNSYLLAQAQFNVDNSVEITDIQELTAGSEAEVICLKVPPVFSTRRIAIKRVAKQSSLASELRRVIRNDLLTDSDVEFTQRRSAWSVAIEVSDYVAPVATSGGGTTTPAPAPTGKVLTYASDGDTNGVCYWLGTNKGTEAWTNPHTAGRVVVSASSVYGSGFDDLAILVNRTSNGSFASAIASNQSVSLDLGSTNKLVCNYYSLRGRSVYADNHLRNWKIQGSNDNTTWVDVDTQINNTTLATDNWLSIPVNSTQSFRHFRLLMNGLNSSNSPMLAFGEFEFYGTLNTTT